VRLEPEVGATGTDASGQDQSDLYDKLALAGRVLAGEGLTRVSYGHISAWSTPAREAIALRGRPASDCGLEFAASGDMVELDLMGTILRGEASPPRESPIHLEILRARPDVASVVHVHPRIVVALRASGIRLLPIYGAYDPPGVDLALDNIGYFSSSKLIDTAERGREVVDALGDKTACVLDGHGVVVVGGSIEAAVLNTIALCELAHVNWMAAAVGHPVGIPRQELSEFLPRPSPSQPSMDPQNSAWQHWVERSKQKNNQPNA
jgi:ribulose-5-phosphate 4-epimerase/fuculose-1-phosphate aldolase